MSTLLTVNIPKLQNEYELLYKNQQEEINQLIENKDKVNWIKYANEQENLFHSYFDELRNLFIDNFTKLEGGRINHYMTQYQDSVSPSNYSHIEKLYMNGWRFEDGEIARENYTIGSNTTRKKYMKFLTEYLN